MNEEIAYFPTPFPNEDYRSILYRFHKCSGNKEVYLTSNELFGFSNEKFTVFPRNLSALFCKMPVNHSFNAESILKEHTLFNIFRPFISTHRLDGLYQEINNAVKPEHSNIGKLVGNKYGRCISEEIRYCTFCMKEDNQNYGVSYMHREHQIAFLDICPIHNQKLITDCPQCHIPLLDVFSGRCKQGHCLLLESGNEDINDDNQLKFKRKIYKDISFLLYTDQRMYRNLIDYRLQNYLFNRGYFKYVGALKRDKIILDICNYFSEEEILVLGLSIEYLKQRNTLEKLLYKDDELVPNIPLYLLLVQFLAGSMKKFIHDEIPPMASQVPFGFGPWCCENKLCPDHKKEVITKCERKIKRSRGITGEFSCTTCGRSYVKEWRWGKGDRGKFGLTSLSEDMKIRVIRLRKEGKLIKDIAIEFYCDPSTIRKVLEKDQSYSRQSAEVISRVQSEINNGLLQISATEIGNLKRDNYRSRLESFISKNPNKNRNEISLECRKEYRWLKEHDNEWLENHLPPSRSINRFSWNLVDLQLSQRVKEIAKQLVESNPGTRVGKYMIINALSKQERGRIKSYLKNLPVTEKTLNENVETVEEYQLRHIPALVKQLRTYYNYTIVSVENILAYRRSYRNCSVEMKRKINDILERLNIGY
ncbi:TnsD family Tn7-like transposition protein [Ammoniphilus sp. CFH 90114]|uniref:TnsD family Tn7-like transposition protein n=1 Tax=Ammoniphilus sp. CFH 90114 TaxID=2493665 RepID=UPI00100FD3F1|nr:TnsD family Tn7-like transposition protein [Ammoniphilus sp. CFH 90114]RXT05272.1 hypothetical protein EIZ39_18010 [Ammoniphilus sp. CFH 90114]